MTRLRIDQKDIRDADIFQTLLDNFPDIIHSVGPDGRIVYANRQAERSLGYAHDELLSMNVRQIYADEVLGSMEAGFSELKHVGQMGAESLLKAKDGTRIPVEIRSFSIYNDSGEFVRTFSILRDIGPIKDLQSGLVHAGRLAAIGELASGIVHDINNPLTVILMCNELMTAQIARVKEDIHPDAESGVEMVSSLVQDVARAAEAIQKLVQHLRNYSRGMAEKYETVDLWTCINDALFVTRHKVIRLQIRVDDQTRKAAYFTRGSPNQIEQVFVNLIGNACDAMDGRDARRLTIGVEPCESNGSPFWRCDVGDTGCGIAPEIQKDIFRSFFTTKQKGMGTGLGLSITRNIAVDHGGKIEFTTVQGKGTTFSVYLPRVPPPPRQVPAAQDEAPAEQAQCAAS